MYVLPNLIIYDLPCWKRMEAKGTHHLPYGVYGVRPVLSWCAVLCESDMILTV